MSTTTTESGMLAFRLQNAKESATAAVAAKARKLAGQGEDIINLGEGELDFPTPQHISDAGIAAIREGKTRYTAVSGTKEIKQAIQHKFLTDNNLDYSTNQIIVATGAKQLIYNALMATVDAGDEVLIPVPSWVSYADIVQICGGTAQLIDCGEQTGFKLTPDDLERAITAKSKWLIMNSPNNPTGAVYSKEELVALADVLEKHPQVLVLCDDIYEHIRYGCAFATMADAVPALFDRVLTVNGVSKVFSMTGWRIGYAGGPEWLIRAMGILQSQSTTNATSISQVAAAAGLNGSLAFFEPRLEALQSRRNGMLDAIRDTESLTALMPDGAFYVYANCQKLIGRSTHSGKILQSDIDVAEYFLEEVGLAMVPGSAFNKSPYLRIAFSVADDLLDQACGRLIEACKMLNDL